MNKIQSFCIIKISINLNEIITDKTRFDKMNHFIEFEIRMFSWKKYLSWNLRSNSIYSSKNQKNQSTSAINSAKSMKNRYIELNKFELTYIFFY